MRYRYLIEVSGDDLWPYALTQVGAEGETLAGGGTYETVEQAKASAQSSVDAAALKWKPPPKAWQPDALCISQYLDDGVEENRDD